jgi:hypothetical protein
MSVEHVLFMGWNRPRAGRETAAAELFGQTVGYLTEQQKAGVIDSFEPVLLSPHGGDMNGFFLIRGDYDKIAKMRNTDDFSDLMTNVNVALDGFGTISGWVGEGLNNQMMRWKNIIPKYTK